MNIWQQNYFENGLEKETKMSLKTNYKSKTIYKSNFYGLPLEMFLLVIQL